jgi:hypothetical protein
MSTATEQVPTAATEVEAGQLVDPDRAGLAAEPSRSEPQTSPSRFAIPISNQKMPLDFEMMPDLSRLRTLYLRVSLHRFLFMVFPILSIWSTLFSWSTWST